MISPSEISRSMPRDKSNYDRIGNPVAYYFARPLSYPVTSALLALGVSADVTSIVSLIFAVAACFSVVLGQPVFGICFVLAWLVFDCADGNIARYTGNGSRAGEFLDAVSGYVLFGFLYASLGFSTGVLWMCMIGGLAGTLAILSRLLMNKYNNLAGAHRQSSGDVSDGNIPQQLVLSAYNITGVGFGLLVIAIVFDLVGLFLVFQLAMGVAITFGVSVRSYRLLKGL